MWKSAQADWVSEGCECDTCNEMKTKTSDC